MGSAPARALGLTVATIFLAAACSQREEQKASPQVQTAPAVQLLPAPLARAELLSTVALASSAFSAGGEYPEAAGSLAGRTFSLKLPFGCDGAAPFDMTRAGYDAKTGTLRISVKPQTWTDTAWARTLVGSETTEALEGFWVRRAWILADDCPTTTLPILPTVTPETETVGVVQVFAKGGSRVLRRDGRPYELTRKLGEGQAPPAGGFRLVLEGRIASPADKRPVRCTSNGPDRRPTCLVIVEIDKVALDTAENERLAEWSA